MLKNLSFLILFLIPLALFAQKKGVITTSDQDLAMRDYMLKISRQLGVTCNYCHNVKNFKDDSMEAYKISKQHMRVVHLLNTEGFVGNKAPRVDCFVCHRGQAKPPYVEPKN